METINFATATHEELIAAGYTVSVRKSQMKSRRTKKSVWGARPSINRSNNTPKTLVTANEVGTGKIRG